MGPRQTIHHRWLVLGFSLLMFCGLGSRPGEGGVSSAIDCPYFDIRDAPPQLKQAIDSILTATNRQLFDFGSIIVPDTIIVLIATRREQFDSAVGGHFPDWGAGCAIPERNTIIVLSPSLYPHRVSLPEVMRHELAHLYLHNLVGWARLPRWMDEGLAMLIGHQWRFGDDWVVGRAVLMGEALPLRQIDGLNRFAEGKARLAYNQSYLAMTFFLDEYGWESFLLFIHKLRSHNKLDPAFMVAVGLDYNGFQREYSRFLESKYNWAALFADSALFWMGLVFLLILLYLYKRHRMKKKVEEWERAAPAEDIFYPAKERGESDRPDRG